MAHSTHRPSYQYMLQRLIGARKAKGLTQNAVADALGTTQAFVSKVERGERRIDPVELVEFAALYERPLSHFLLPPALKATTTPLDPAEAATIRALADKQGESTETFLKRALRAHTQPPTT